LPAGHPKSARKMPYHYCESSTSVNEENGALSISLASVVNCNTRHADQSEYLRGLIKRKGRFPEAEK
jgi:hypothetical protein